MANKKRFDINLDDFNDEIFHTLEKVADWSGNHRVEFYAENKTVAAKICAERLIPLIEKFMAEVLPDEGDS